jgi:hypothetical protein
VAARNGTERGDLMREKIRNPRQSTLFGENDLALSSAKSSTFSDNMALPVHRWFRYSAGFSALWVKSAILSAQTTGTVRVLDPFAGSGTVLVEAEDANVPSIGVESHPFVARVARAKIHSGIGADSFRKYGLAMLKRAAKIKPDVEGYSVLIRKCYPDEALAHLDQLRQAWAEYPEDQLSELGWLALAAVLRQCSPVGTANWQYVLPKKSKANASQPFTAFRAKIEQMCFDLEERPKGSVIGTLIQGDARELFGVPDQWATLVITSPPYPNNFDYADATRLEMTFFGEIAGWGDLQDAVRKYLVRSCTQHVSPIVGDTDKILQSVELDPIRPEIAMVCARLEKERSSHGGKKNYHTMIAAYFLDMAKVWKQLRRVTARGARVCFVIGDSAPYGVYVPVDAWMGQLAVASGFRSSSFEKTRDRNVKWKNRKHRVPLQEGRLWVEG